MRRHDMAIVSPTGWRALLEARPDLAAEPLVPLWIDNGWPLVGRRGLPGEGEGIPLGLPLPPFAGKRRLSVLVRPHDIVSTARPPGLRAASRVAPRAWWPTLDRLETLGSRHALDPRVFGSLAWRALTGMDYLTESSDLDVLLGVHPDTDLLGLAADLAAIEAAAPMRIDGELIRSDGAAVNWREFRPGAREVLIKTSSGVALLDAALFPHGGMPS